MSSAKRCRIAFAGAGGMVAEHARAFGSLPNVELVGIYNRTKAKATVIADLHAIPCVSDDLEAMLSETMPDIVVMAVYETAILELASRILAHPSALFMEKPIGLDLPEAQKLHRLAKVSGRKVWVGLNRRTLGATQAALADLSKHPGPRFIFVQDQQSLETARAIGHSPVVVENWMYANSIHLVDYLLTFGRGEVADIKVLQPWDERAPGVVLAHVSFASGDRGIYQAIWNGPGPWACVISTPHRRWELRPLEKAVFQNAGERALNEVPASGDDLDYKPGFRLQAEKVVGAWCGDDTGAATIDDALVSTELLARIYGLEHKG
ncbi:MAG: Gfo/Idh/MocA family protein [Allorhizobium sp.]